MSTDAREFVMNVASYFADEIYERANNRALARIIINHPDYGKVALENLSYSYGKLGIVFSDCDGNIHAVEFNYSEPHDREAW